jgi:hypothetical protein
MDWVTALWAMLIGGGVAIAVPHLLIGIWQDATANTAPVWNPAKIFFISQ